jgi:hypothetical protein
MFNREKNIMTTPKNRESYYKKAQEFEGKND